MNNLIWKEDYQLESELKLINLITTNNFFDEEANMEIINDVLIQN
jgi:hypothetical protein